MPVGAGIAVGAFLLLSREEEPEGPTTTAAEAGTVSDLAKEVECRYDEVARMVNFCDRERNLYADTGGEGYEVCAKQEVEPVKEAADELLTEAKSGRAACGRFAVPSSHWTLAILNYPRTRSSGRPNL